MITHRLERLLSKRRILELYLNVVEWGDGTWGAEAASRHYFRKSASGLGASEAALLAGALINPNRLQPERSAAAAAATPADDPATHGHAGRAGAALGARRVGERGAIGGDRRHIRGSVSAPANVQ